MGQIQVTTLNSHSYNYNNCQISCKLEEFQRRSGEIIVHLDQVTKYTMLLHQAKILFTAEVSCVHWISHVQIVASVVAVAGMLNSPTLQHCCSEKPKPLAKSHVA